MPNEHLWGTKQKHLFIWRFTPFHGTNWCLIIKLNTWKKPNILNEFFRLIKCKKETKFNEWKGFQNLVYIEISVQCNRPYAVRLCVCCFLRNSYWKSMLVWFFFLCTHYCYYCLAGKTFIWMAKGSCFSFIFFFLFVVISISF